MKRGEVWIAAGEGDYVGKPRPVVVIQSDLFPSTESVTVCPLTSEFAEASAVRLTIAVNPDNGLRAASYVMVDKLSTVRRTRLARQVGTLSRSDLTSIDDAILLFLGIATSRA